VIKKRESDASMTEASRTEAEARRSPQYRMHSGGLLRELLSTSVADRTRSVLENPQRFKLQLFFSEVQSSNGIPELVQHSYNVDDKAYFYPASTIKLCIAVSALQMIRQLRLTSGLPIDIHTRLTMYPLRSDPQESPVIETTVAEEMQKMFAISDNAAFNRLFSLVGHREANESMWRAGLSSARVGHLLSHQRSIEENLTSPRIDLHTDLGTWTVPERKSDLNIDNGSLKDTYLGEGYMQGDEFHSGPMSFLKKNRISLSDLHRLVIMIARPDLKIAGESSLDLEENDRSFLMECMGLFPRDAGFKSYGDDYCKPLLPGLSRVLPRSQWRVHNKIGRAYGFTLDTAYVSNADSSRAFFVSVVLYTNANNIMNDDKYEYSTVADPFIEALGETLARYVYEVPPMRAVWVTRFDWKTKEDVETVIDQCSQLGLTDIMFQVRGNGTVLYESDIEPWAEEVGSSHPGWDPLHTAIGLAHGRGMKIHGWMNLVPAWRGLLPPTDPRQLYNAKPEWMWYDQQGRRQPLCKNFYVSINVCLPEVREYLVGVAQELIDRYSTLDGLHLDYVRFPNEPPAIPVGSGIDYPRDERTLDLFKQATGGLHPDSAKKEWNQWRCDTVTDLVQRLRDAVTKTNARRDPSKRLVMTCSIGPVRDLALQHLQDSKPWLDRNLLDMAFPMNYTPDTDLFVSRLSDAWRPYECGCPVVAGLGLYMCSDAVAHEQIGKAVSLTTSLCLFSYASIKALRAELHSPTTEPQEEHSLSLRLIQTLAKTEKAHYQRRTPLSL